MKIRRKAAILAAMAIAMSVIWHAPAAPSLFTSVEGFATKTGFRGVFAWQASQPVKAVVHYGVDPQALDASTVALPGAPDAAGMTIIDGLEAGATYYWQVEDLVTGEKSEVSNFKAANAYNDWDGQTYTLDLLIQLDSESLPPGVPWDLASENTAAGVNIFAERLYDAMDGFARLGNVIITDTETDNAGSVPFVPGTGCAAVEGAGGNLADVLIQTTLPFDSHTFSGWAIDEPCTSFYVGRIGQLVSPWGEIGPEDLHFGFVATHEMMHYAFNAPDLYGASDINDPRSSGCWDLSWDGSLMHNSGGWNGKRWELTELDRNPHLTPCDHSFADSYSWGDLRERYIQVPERPNGPIEHIIDTQARGNEDGGALDIKILDRFGPVSSLKTFTPDDTNPPPLPEVPVADCNNNGGPILIDPAGDSGANLAPPEATLDIIDGSLKWDASAAAMTFEIGLGSVEDRNPGTAPEIAFNFNFTHGEEQLYVEGYRGLSGEKRFVVGAFLGTPAVNPRIHLADVTGEFNAAKDEVNIVLPNSVLGAIDSKPFESGDRITEMNIVSRRAANTSLATYGPTADTTEGACDFVVGTGTSPMPPPLDVRLSEPNLIYQWQGSRSTNIEREPLLGEEVFGCAGFDGPGCEEKRIYVSAPGLLDVSIEGENPDVNDFDLYLYDAEGKEIDSSENSGGIEAVSATVTSPGIYTVSVHAWLTIDAAYIGLAELTPLVPRSDVIRPRPSSPSSSSQPNPQKANRKEPALRPKVAPAPAPVESGPSIKAPPDDVRQVAAPVQVPTKGVSTTTGATAAAAALLVGLALGFTLARRRESR